MVVVGNARQLERASLHLGALGERRWRGGPVAGSSAGEARRTAGVVDPAARPCAPQRAGRRHRSGVRRRCPSVGQRRASVAISLSFCRRRRASASVSGSSPVSRSPGRSAHAAASRTARSHMAGAASGDHRREPVEQRRQDRCARRCAHRPRRATARGPSAAPASTSSSCSRRAHQVDVQAGDRQRQRGLEIVAERRRNRSSAAASAPARHRPARG